MEPRGHLSERLLAGLRDGRAARLGADRLVDSAGEDDLQLSLYCLYELHYGGLPEIDAAMEWDPGVLALRRRIEARFESELQAMTGDCTIGPGDVVDELWAMANRTGGPSLSAWFATRATRAQARELFVHRSAYQLKEADPHTWAIPRLRGAAKAVMVEIQSDEYGKGSAADMHSALFATTMEAAGLNPEPNGYLDVIPGYTLATVNLISLLGLHRRLRGALVGHLALFEMTSTGPMRRYSQGVHRLGLPAAARRFFDVHVEADEVHQHLAADGMVAGLLADDPGQAGAVLFGARALTAVERRFSEEVLGAWTSGRSSLYLAADAAGTAA